jgi:WhiB family redox-sensing transcriptional regulator
MDWRNKGACTDEPPELFFPLGNAGPAATQIAAAKAVCGRCPVTEQCLAWAMAHEDHGVWGGRDEFERRERRGIDRRRIARRGRSGRRTAAHPAA